MCVWFVCPDDLFMQIANPPGNKVNASFALWRCILLSKQLPWTFLPSKEGKGLPLGVQQTQVVLGEGAGLPPGREPGTRQRVQVACPAAPGLHLLSSRGAELALQEALWSGLQPRRHSHSPSWAVRKAFTHNWSSPDCRPACPPLNLIPISC